MMDIQSEEKTWKCNKCGYETVFNVLAGPEAIPKKLCVCGIAGPSGNCTGMLILQDDEDHLKV